MYIFRKFKKIYEKIFIYFIMKDKRIIIKNKVNIHGVPLIDIRNKSKLIIEDNVTLTSKNRGYHLNMYGPVKIMADKEQGLISIGKNTRIHGSCLHACKSIIIGRNCLIAANCQIIDSNGHDLSFDDVENRINTKGIAKEVYIEDNVWIGANSIILPGVRIGFGSVIAANSVVKNDIPSMVLAGGNPAIIIKKYRKEINNDSYSS